jgi:hypothetical protein
MFQIPEGDWRVLRDLKQELLDTASDEVLQRADAILAARQGRPYEALLELRSLLDAEDRRLAVLFDDMRPTTAMVRIINLCKLGLFKEEHFARLSPATRDRIIALLEERR